MTPAPRALPAPGRITQLPWGTLALAVASGVILLAQSMGLPAALHTGWLLSADHLRGPSLLTYAFFHADVLHWAVNMALLLAVAPRLERALGTPAMLIVFLFGAMVAGLVHVSVVTLFAHSGAARPLLGSSGGIMALLGVYSVRYYGHRISTPRAGPGAAKAPGEKRGLRFSVPLGWALFAWVLTEAVFGWRSIADGRGTVAHWAHIGGFLAGMSFAVLAGLHKVGRREDAAAQTSLDQQAERLSTYLRDHPEDIASRVTFAQTLLQLGDPERAAAAYCRAVEMCLQTGRRREAAEIWLALRAARLQPATSALEIQAARALEETGYREEALALYDRLSANPGPESESAALRAAQLAERLGQPDSAMQRYQVFLMMHPDSQFVVQARRSLDRLLSRV
jgi:membrane associated rhomboid family serine protease